MTGLEGVELKHLETLDEAFEFMRWLGERRPVLGFDTETGGLRWWDDDLRLVQFGDAQTGWVISYRDWRGVVAQAMESYDRPIVAHNLAFDAKFAIREGLPLKRHLYHDTLAMHHLLDPPAPHGLKPLSTDMVDPYAHAGQAALDDGMRKQGWTWATVPDDFAPYIWYSALDGVLVARLWEILEPQIRAGGFEPSYELELENIWATSVDAARRGMCVDEEYTRSEQLRLLNRADDIWQNAKANYGVSLGSGAQVTELLEEAGVPLWKKTASGNWSLDKEVLEELSGAHPLADQVIEYKRALKFARAYFGGVLDRLTGPEDERLIHADINSLGARTGRMSVSNPALQQIPSTDPGPRRMFIPRKDNVLLSADLSNIEVRLLAHFAQEPTMLAAFRAGEDVHMMMARRMYGPDAGPKDRKRSKSGSLGKQFGIGIEKFAQQQKMPVQEVRAFFDYYDETFPAVQQFIDDVEHIARERRRDEHLAYIKAPDGRVHTLTPQEAREDAYYKLINYICQGHAAVLLKRAVARLASTEFGQYYVMPVHDELLLDVPRGLAADAGRTLHDIMINVDDGKLTLPLGCDVEIYPESWAQSVEGQSGKLTLAEWIEQEGESA